MEMWHVGFTGRDHEVTIWACRMAFPADAPSQCDVSGKHGFFRFYGEDDQLAFAAPEHCVCYVRKDQRQLRKPSSG